jgi:hypothetical protein
VVLCVGVTAVDAQAEAALTNRDVTVRALNSLTHSLTHYNHKSIGRFGPGGGGTSPCDVLSIHSSCGTHSRTTLLTIHPLCTTVHKTLGVTSEPQVIGRRHTPFVLAASCRLSPCAPPLRLVSLCPYSVSPPSLPSPIIRPSWPCFRVCSRACSTASRRRGGTLPTRT